MPYNSLERRIAALLDSAPGLRSFAKAGYQRVNYLLRRRGARPVELHPLAAVARNGACANGRDLPTGEECFFGYFGIPPWSADGGRMLFHRWRAGDPRRIEVWQRDLATGSARMIGGSCAWNFQQGSLAQWLQLDGIESVVFNDAADGRLVCRIVAPDGSERRLPWPVQALNPRAPEALSLNYRRLARLRPEYGYDVEVENFAPDQPLASDGLWRIDLRSGEGELVVSLDRLARNEPRPDMRGAEHKVNHAIYALDGRRFAFMHRWLGPTGKYSRLYVANADGSGLRLLFDHRMVSHYAWRDERTLLAWARTAEQGDRYYLVDVASADVRPLPVEAAGRYGDGHPSYSPDGQWIVTDSYPDRARMLRLLLLRPDEGRMVEVGRFHSPWRYDGPSRCDLHPRWSPDGRRISIDSTHEGIRWTYAVDVSRLVGPR